MTKCVLIGALGGMVLTLGVVALVLTYVGVAELLAGIQAIGSLAIAFSAIIAYLLFRANVSRHAKEDRRAESKIFLDESIALLNRSYEIFTRFGDYPPINNKLLWISTARMIVRYQNMRKQIKEKDHQAIVDENEEYFRVKFHTLLDSCKDKLTVDYFVPSDFPNESGNVPRNSVVVIFNFAKWHEDVADQFDKIIEKESFASKEVPIDLAGVDNFTGYAQQSEEKIQKKSNFSVIRGEV